MPLDLNKTRKCLADFEFQSLFLDELGWDQFDGTLPLKLGDQTVSLKSVAEKKGMTVYLCPMSGKTMDYQTRCKIEVQLAKRVREHLVIYVDKEHGLQIWQWVKREPGKPLARREHVYNTKQAGDALIQKLEYLQVTLEEEEKTTLPDITGKAKKAFDLEKITKRFYDRFKVEHAAFLKFIEGIPDEDLERWYASVMINRLMFIYFIQKKGFLNGDKDYLRTKLKEYVDEPSRLVKPATKRDASSTFYRDFLCPLFFDGFAKKERSAATNKLLGKVPYLNGGIFQPHQIERDSRHNIEISNKAFEKLFAFFDEWQWHLDDRPLRDDTEINPDVLGYIFEKYINQKQMGAYYTKEDITDYIGKNTIIPRLFDVAKVKCKVAFEERGTGVPPVWSLLRENPDRYIYDAVKHGVELPLPPEIEKGVETTKPDLIERRKEWNKPASPEYALPTEIWREVVARRQRYAEIKTRLTGKVDEASRLVTPTPTDRDGPSTINYFDPSEPIANLSGNLPHWRQQGVAYFVTFRLADSLPQEKLRQWLSEREAWMAGHPEPHDDAARAKYYSLFPDRLQNWLDSGYGSCVLARSDIRSMVENVLRHFDGTRYRLLEFVIMPNHVHVLVTPQGEHTLSEILHSWKSYTSHEINKLLKKEGANWQQESFDHILRNAEQQERVRQYIRDNPRKADVASRPAQIKQNDFSATITSRDGSSTSTTKTKRDASSTIHEINDLITLNLNIRQFAQDVIENCEGPELLVAFWNAIESVTVLDPTCGSGAFLFAALNILEPLYEACLDRMQAFLDEWEESGTAVPAVNAKSSTGQRPLPHSKNKHPIYKKLFSETLARVEKHPNRLYFIFKAIILNNLYGVDIMEEAVEICKLRLFLRLVAQVDSTEKIEPLPDIDFNIRAGNTLVGFATEKQAENVLRQDLLAYNTVWPEIKEDAQNVANAYQDFKDQQTRHGGQVTGEDKKMLSDRFRQLEDKLNRYLASDYGVEVEKESDTESGMGVSPVPHLSKYQQWLKSHQPFHWFVEFYGIMSKGGFDVIIGNPPYIAKEKVQKLYRLRNYVTEECPDIYANVIERASSLLKIGGHTGMIVPLSLTFSRDFAKLRSFLFQQYCHNWFSSFARIPAALFSADVRVRNTIHIGWAGKTSSQQHSTVLHRWFEAARLHLFANLQYAPFDPKPYKGLIPKIGSSALSKAFEACFASTRKTVAAFFSPSITNHVLHFKKSAYNWLNFCRRLPPCFDENGRRIAHTKFGDVYFHDQETKNMAFLLLNGKIMFTFWCMIGDDFDVTQWMFADLPVDFGAIRPAQRKQLLGMADALDKMMQTNTSYKLNAGKKVGNYNLALCRSITDQSDALFAECLGMSDVWQDIELVYTQVVKTDFSTEEE